MCCFLFALLLCLQQPGKLNLKNFAIVNEAIARMNVSSDNNMPEGDNKKLGVLNKRSLFEHAPLAAPEDDSDDLAYAQVKDVYGLDGVVGSAPDPNMFNYTHDSSTSKSSKLRHRREKSGQSKCHMHKYKKTVRLCLIQFTISVVKFDLEYSESDSESSSSECKNRAGYDGYYKMNRKAQTHKRTRKKRTAIPVQPPKIPFGTYVSPPEIPLLYQKMKTERKLGSIEKGIFQFFSFYFFPMHKFIIHNNCLQMFKRRNLALMYHRPETIIPQS